MPDRIPRHYHRHDIRTAKGDIYAEEALTSAPFEILKAQLRYAEIDPELLAQWIRSNAP